MDDLSRRPTFTIGWGYDVEVSLSLPDRNQAKLERGLEFTVRGGGYYYEGDFYWDFWDFSGGAMGHLTVRYGSPKDRDYSGVGYDGLLREAINARE